MSSPLNEDTRFRRAMAVIAWTYVKKEAPHRVILDQPSYLYNDIRFPSTALANSLTRLICEDDADISIEATYPNRNFEASQFYGTYGTEPNQILIRFFGKSFVAVDYRSNKYAEFDGEVEYDNIKVKLTNRKNTAEYYEFKIYPEH